jgi:hypothetical protein
LASTLTLTLTPPTPHPHRVARARARAASLIVVNAHLDQNQTACEVGGMDHIIFIDHRISTTTKTISIVDVCIFFVIGKKIIVLGYLLEQNGDL